MCLKALDKVCGNTVLCVKENKDIKKKIHCENGSMIERITDFMQILCLYEAIDQSGIYIGIKSYVLDMYVC